MNNSKVITKIITAITAKNPSTEKELFNMVRTEAGKLKLDPPEKSLLLAAYRRLLKNGQIKKNSNIEKILVKRKVRSQSGVTVISVLTKSLPCPGKCLFCPTEKNMPKSYLSNEPAVMRAILNDFDPFRQVAMRLKALQANGHATDKIELIVMGGTWSYHQTKYQNWFIKRCFDALNGRTSKTLALAQKKNETTKHRCIGLTLETRPDYINLKEIQKMRELGCTRVELGIQHTDDKILKINRRGHTAKQSIEAIRLLKDAGFKINLHLMPNLYGSTPAKDLAMFKKIYTDGNYMPDMIKIYPCVVNKFADLHKLYKQNKYKPYTDKQLLELLIKIKKITPPWVRITRLIRDIPEESIVAGNKITNLRQLLQDQAKKDGWSCQCIRCREAGHQNNLQLTIGNLQNILKLVIRKYAASSGQEYFISYESNDKKVLYAFLRLRFSFYCHSEGVPPKAARPWESPDSLNNKIATTLPTAKSRNDISIFFPELNGAALVRELHTYGEAVPLGKTGEVQHLGLGKKLLTEAEKISKKNGYKKIAVIAGVGVRKYYEKFGYRLEGTYMVKFLQLYR